MYGQPLIVSTGNILYITPPIGLKSLFVSKRLKSIIGFLLISTGFDIGSIDNFPETVEPSREELDALYKVDPLGVRYREFD